MYCVYFSGQDPMASFDVNDHDDDPSPRYDATDSNRLVDAINFLPFKKKNNKKNTSHLLGRHGTRCAGEVAAQGNNSICAVGIAFNANIGGTFIISASD
jgi:hypothetical protein